MRPIALFLAQQNRSRRIPPPSRFPDEPEWPPRRPVATGSRREDGRRGRPARVPAGRPLYLFAFPFLSALTSPFRVAIS